MSDTVSIKFTSEQIKYLLNKMNDELDVNSDYSDDDYVGEYEVIEGIIECLEKGK